jgi:putative tryptophan/tyrosine transport system substrate-binding protein
MQLDQLKRRDFIALLGSGAAAAWPLTLRAQQRERMRRIGVLLFGTPNTDPNLGAFLQGLRELGYIESQNVVIDYRYAEGKPDRLRGLAGELVATKPDLIFALGGDVAPSARSRPALSLSLLRSVMILFKLVWWRVSPGLEITSPV